MKMAYRWPFVSKTVERLDETDTISNVSSNHIFDLNQTICENSQPTYRPFHEVINLINVTIVSKC